MVNTDYNFQALSEENMHWLIPLYKKVFNKNYQHKQIHAKFTTNYTGLAAQGHFAILNEEVVAFHGAIPVVMQYKDQTELAAQYGDAMTLKGHTGKGLFTKLGILTDELLKQKGVRFVWGFPNQNSEYGYVNKLNWKGNNRMQAFIIPLSKVSEEVLRRKANIGVESFQEKIKRIIEPIRIEKVNLQSVNTDQYPSVQHSTNFFEYKSFSPNYMIDLAGCKVWIKTEGGLLVGDVEQKSEEQFTELIQHLVQLGKKLGLHQLVFQFSPNSTHCQWMKKHYKAVDSWLIGYKNFNSDFPLEELQLTYGDLDTF
jgi:hypothetical protein